MPTKIFVGNLDVESTPELEDELKSLFAQFGTVTECAILTGKNFGFVHMEREEEAKIAIAGLNGHEFQGSQLNVELSPNQGSRGERRGNGGRGGRGDSRGGRGGRGSRGGYDSGGRGRGRGGRGGRGDGRKDYGSRDSGRERYDPYARKSSHYSDPYGEDPYADPYAAAPRRPPARDPYADDPYLRDPYARDPYADPYLRDPYARDPYRDPYLRDPYARDPYARPPPDYYSRSRDPYADPLAARSRDPYAYDRGVGREEDLVSYPPPRGANGYAKDSYGARE